MSIRHSLKSLVEAAPESLVKPLIYVPYTLRLGAGYWRSCDEILKFQCKSVSEQEEKCFYRLRELVHFAADKIPFYQEFYREKGFSVDQLDSWDDWGKVPVVTKADLQNYSLRSRSLSTSKKVEVNTGGTSGQPLHFFLDSSAFAREWAHMHFFWKARGYRPYHVKLTFRGKHFDQRQPIRYNAVHNEYVVNSSCAMNTVAEAVMALPQDNIIRWLHGYPSLIAEFAHSLSHFPDASVTTFRSRLFGILLGSEYPAPSYRRVIESVLSNNIVSWYGHSEMAVLARETSLGVYESMPTYGYAEAVTIDQSSEQHLVATSLHNRVHPFIRYDTGDLIEPLSQQGGALEFRITEGRVGDFVRDLQGKRHSLTAIIFGRHHPSFSFLQHIQVREESPGNITLVATPQDKAISPQKLMSGFDLDDLDIQWQLEVVESPVRTPAGKIRLKIA
ncbi:hypothetical protein ACM26W_11920 [Halomonas sp. HK25]|uniref:hypothetical protein n=1 Tax=Halomonas sp. HK25 TaxID=3394321 RepID=UPI0039FC7576